MLRAAQKNIICTYACDSHKDVHRKPSILIVKITLKLLNETEVYFVEYSTHHNWL